MLAVPTASAQSQPGSMPIKPVICLELTIVQVRNQYTCGLPLYKHNRINIIHTGGGGGSRIIHPC